MAKNGYSEEEIKKLKRAKADPVIAPDNGQVLWEVSVEGPSIAPFIGRKYQHDEVFCYLSTPWGEYEKDSDRIYRTCGGNMCATRYQCT